MESEGLLPCSRELIAASSPEPHETSPSNNNLIHEESKSKSNSKNICHQPVQKLFSSTCFQKHEYWIIQNSNYA
jgi:hypothetical protein